MALPKLKEYFQKTNINEFQQLISNRLLVVEKISAPSFYVQKTSTGFEFYKGTNKEPLTIVDRTIMSLYEPAIKHINSLNKEQQDKMPLDWKFGFEYLPEKDVSEYKYTTLPYNNLILTHIQQITGTNNVKKTIIDPNILNKWAAEFDVAVQKVIFDGHLNYNQKQELTSLLAMNNKEFDVAFNYNTTDSTPSFTQKIYKLFNPNANQTTLQDNLNHEIDGLIINSIEGKKIKSFKLEDFNKQTINKERTSSHIYQITIADILEFVSQIKIDDIELKAKDLNAKYIELICLIFNQYVDKNATKYIGVDFESADFAQTTSFNINTKFIKNNDTLQYLHNQVLAELFKIMLGTFKKERTKPSDIITSDMLISLNKVINKIKDKIAMENTNEHVIFDYHNFMLYQNNINEALNVEYVERGKEDVNIFVGRFQPFTLGHAKVLETIYRENNLPIIVFLIKAAKKKKGDEFSRPYSEELQTKMFQAVQKQYSFLKEIIILPSAAIDKMFNVLRPKYEPILWGTGTDRMKAYGYQVNNQSYREQLNVKPEFQLFEIPRSDKNISATDVRNAMLADDESSFKKMTPKAVHPMYNELRSKLKKSMAIDENVHGDFLTFAQFMANK